MKKLLFIALVLFGSCKKDDAGDTAAPIISSVTTTTDRSTSISSGALSAWVQIKGMHLATTQTVRFNTLEVSASALYATDTSVTVQIPAAIADSLTNKVTVITKYGQADYAFRVEIPAPVITAFNPAVGNAGTVVNIAGNWFQNLEQVKVGTLTADILSKTDTTIQVKIPDAYTTPGYFYITTTTGGTTKSANPFGMSYAIYDDAANADWWFGPWSADASYGSTEKVHRGTGSIKVQYTGGYGGFQCGAWVDVKSYQGIRLSIYGGSGTKGMQVKLYINGVAGTSALLTLTEGAWTDYSVPFSALGNPDILSALVIQEFSNNNSLIYIDDLGLF
ncbi:IPT/TIG domain-containing protein [Chitinophaga sancti]|uniref:IPT/TIG domain-containing protein n=1 Tax=Chitinophaga sancti TaxID=1004 RepID=A0A1K1N9S5_9BACT|nr:IPT/TIG domain-containing protein [Chitinophaga sancti]WQD63426.1 IPT/TIG domain-containing protein [Chitinophaga sancti]WQG90948.1 IPT/TIG domain-containing protein [Chitinophaga sancti]SFW32200.1 IPT/TIG domain-containing protein [Chitinophaga sancti]